MAKHICKHCGHVGNPKMTCKGSLGVEILMWLFFIFPGIIYSAWRMSTYANTCPACKSNEVVPINSPIGKKLVKKLSV